MKRVVCFIAACIAFVTSESVSISAALETQCFLADVKCVTNNYGTLLKRLAQTGLPSANIPIIDPTRLTDIVTTLPNNVKLTLIEGQATGIKNCVHNTLHTYTEGVIYSTLNKTCDLEIDGQFQVSFPNSFIKELGGEDVKKDVVVGTSHGKLTMEGVHLNFYIPYRFELRNKDIYITFQKLDLTNDAKVKINIDGFEHVSKTNNDKIVDYLAEHASVMKPVTVMFEKILDFYQLFADNFVSQIPANNYIKDDLSHFIKKITL